MFSANEHAVGMKLVTIGYSVASRGYIDAHVIAGLGDPGILNAIGLARCADPIELAAGPVVLPPIDDAVTVAIGLDAPRPAVQDVGAHIDPLVAVGVVIETPHRARTVVNGR